MKVLLNRQPVSGQWGCGNNFIISIYNYFPNFEEDITPRLSVAVGSHRTMINERTDDLKIVSILPKVTIYSSNNQALFFDTSLLHAAIPEEPNSKSIRLIYSFILKEQLLNSTSEELHFKTSKIYEDLFQ